MNKMLLCLGGAIFATAAVSSAIAFGPAERRAKALAEYQPAGEPVDCVTVTRIRSTKIIDNRTIDFKLAGGKVYRNTLPHNCPGLAMEDRFSYRVSTSQLCSVDIIRVLQNMGGQLSEGAGCGLGKFQPVEKAAKVEEISYSDGEWAPFEVVEPGDVIG
jgi:hypothetical protein